MIDSNREILSLRPRIVFRAVLDEGVIVQMDSGRVIVVNAVGLFLLPILKKPVRREELITALVDNFEVSPGQAASDLDEFIRQLDREEILSRSN